MQSLEVITRPIDIPKLKIRVGNRTSTAPFEKNYLNQLLSAVDEFVGESSENYNITRNYFVVLYIFWNNQDEEFMKL